MEEIVNKLNILWVGGGGGGSIVNLAGRSLDLLSRLLVKSFTIQCYK